MISKCRTMFGSIRNHVRFAAHDVWWFGSVRKGESLFSSWEREGSRFCHPRPLPSTIVHSSTERRRGREAERTPSARLHTPTAVRRDLKAANPHYNGRDAKCQHFAKKGLAPNRTTCEAHHLLLTPNWQLRSPSSAHGKVHAF